MAQGSAPKSVIDHRLGSYIDFPGYVRMDTVWEHGDRSTDAYSTDAQL